MSRTRFVGYHFVLNLCVFVRLTENPPTDNEREPKCQGQDEMDLKGV